MEHVKHSYTVFLLADWTTTGLSPVSHFLTKASNLSISSPGIVLAHKKIEHLCVVVRVLKPLIIFQRLPDVFVVLPPSVVLRHLSVCNRKSQMNHR